MHDASAVVPDWRLVLKRRGAIVHEEMLHPLRAIGGKSSTVLHNGTNSAVVFHVRFQAVARQKHQ
jgi:hypothetical protein